MGDDIGKTDHHGKDVEDLVFLIQAQRQIDPETDIHDVTEDQIPVDFIGNMEIILPEFGKQAEEKGTDQSFVSVSLHEMIQYRKKKDKLDQNRGVIIARPITAIEERTEDG